MSRSSRRCRRGLSALVLGAGLATPAAALAEPGQGKEHLAAPAVQLRAGDGERFLAVGGFFQARAGVGGFGWTNSDLSLHRTRLYVYGNPISKAVRVRLMIGSEGANQIGVFDAYAEWSTSGREREGWQGPVRVRVGRTKIPVLRDWVEAAPLLAGAGRAGPTLAVLPGRAPGVTVATSAFDEAIEGVVGVFLGAGDVGIFRETRGVSVAGRALWNATGRTIEGEVDFDNSPTAVSMGGSALAGFALGGDCAPATFGIESPRLTTLTSCGPLNAVVDGRRTLLGGELLLRSRGWDFGGEVLFGRDRALAPSTRAGGYVRADRYIQQLRTSVGTRLSRLIARGDEARRESTAEVDVSHYFSRHDLKLTGDIGVVLRDGNRTPSPLARLQFQAQF